MTMITGLGVYDLFFASLKLVVTAIVCVMHGSGHKVWSRRRRARVHGHYHRSYLGQHAGAMYLWMYSWCFDIYMKKMIAIIFVKKIIKTYSSDSRLPTYLSKSDKKLFFLKKKSREKDVVSLQRQDNRQ